MPGSGFGDYGVGPVVVLLHAGIGNAGNFGHQVPTLTQAGYRVIAIDIRGHGRNSWDGRPFSYKKQFADDLLAGLDKADIGLAAVVGWGDGACTALAMAKSHPDWIAGVLFFACNVDSSGAWPFEMTETIQNCLMRHQKDYSALSPTPEELGKMHAALQVMQGTSLIT